MFFLPSCDDQAEIMLDFAGIRRPLCPDCSARNAAASAPGASSSSFVSTALVWMIRATHPVQPV